MKIQYYLAVYHHPYLSIVTCLVINFFGTQAYTQSNLGFVTNPRTSFYNHSSLFKKGLADACIAISSLNDDLPCAPSLLALNNKTEFKAFLSLSNGYSSFNLVRELVNNSLNEEFVDLLLEKKIFQLDAGAALYFKSEHFSGKYIPFSIRAFTGLRNEVDPNVELLVVDEKGFYFQSSYSLSQLNLSLGAQVRILDRKYINASFKATELSSGMGEDNLNGADSRVIFVDPSITYFVPEYKKLIITLMFKNIGYNNIEDESLKEPIDLQAGGSLSFDIYQYGELTTSVEYNRVNYEESFLEALRFSATHSYGSMKLLGGIDQRGFSFGINSEIESFNAGLIYTTTQIPNIKNESYSQAVYLQIGWRSSK